MSEEERPINVVHEVEVGGECGLGGDWPTEIPHDQAEKEKPPVLEKLEWLVRDNDRRDKDHRGEQLDAEPDVEDVRKSDDEEEVEQQGDKLGATGTRLRLRRCIDWGRRS